MLIGDPILHMDPAYMWRWYVPDASGQLVFMSIKEFFSREEALRDRDAMYRPKRA